MITEILLVQFLCYGSAQVLIAEAVPLMSTELDHGLTTAIRHDSANKTKIPETTMPEGTNSLKKEGIPFIMWDPLWVPQRDFLLRQKDPSIPNR